MAKMAHFEHSVGSDYELQTQMSALEATARFSDRVENYVKYRPKYPQEIIAKLSD